MKRKILALLLAMCLLIGCLPEAALAVDSSNSESTFQAYIDHEYSSTGYKVKRFWLASDNTFKTSSGEVYHGDLVTVDPSKSDTYQQGTSSFNGTDISWIIAGDCSGYIFSEYLSRVFPYLKSGESTDTYEATAMGNLSLYSVPVGGTDYKTGTVKSGDSVTVYPEKSVILSNVKTKVERAYAWIKTVNGETGYVKMSNVKSATPGPDESTLVCVVTLDATGGTVDTPPRELICRYGQPYGELSTATRSGYTFDGWYTAPTGGTRITSTSIVPSISFQTLYAHWTRTATYTVSFNLNGKSGNTPNPISVVAGEKITLPTAVVDGYRCTGWYNGNTKWTNSTPVTSDVTLYARWDYDRFNFLNAGSAFGSGKKHTVTGQYLQALQESVPSQNWGRVQDYMDDEWNGSCYGMSALYCLRAADRIDPAKFQNGANVLYDFPKPIQSATTRNLIEYYYLQQATPHGSNGFYPSKFENHEYNRQLVELLTAGNGPVLISFLFGSSNRDEASGHGIVGLSCSKNTNGTYSVLIWDPNQEENDTITVSSDYKTLQFASGKYSYANVFCNQPVSQSSSTFDKVNIQDYIFNGVRVNTNTTMNSFSTTMANCTVTSADGKTAVFKDGKYVSGTMDVTFSIAAEGAVASSLKCHLPESSQYTITSNSNGAGKVSVSIGDYHVDLDSAGLDTVTVSSDGEVKVSSSKAAQQNVSITSDNLGNTWNTVTASGKDTNFTVKAGADSANVATGDSTNVTVRGSNIYTGKTSKAKTVSGSDVEIKLSDLPADSNSKFKDVSSSAYYYNAVIWAVENGITAGTSATTFSPNASCTRAQAVTFLWRAAGSPKASNRNNPFTDVSPNEYYYEAVLWAVENNITAGTSATSFSPNATCTRGQIVTFLHRLAGTPSSSASNSFNDVSANQYYYNAVQWAAANDITSGTGNGKFSPNSSCTRAQIVTFLYRAYA